MAVAVPYTPEQQKAMANLALSLARVSAEAAEVTRAFGKPPESEAITVEGRPLEALLSAISTQVSESAHF